MYEKHEQSICAQAAIGRLQVGDGRFVPPNDATFLSSMHDIILEPLDFFLSFIWFSSLG